MSKSISEEIRFNEYQMEQAANYLPDALESEKDEIFDLLDQAEEKLTTLYGVTGLKEPVGKFTSSGDYCNCARENQYQSYMDGSGNLLCEGFE